MKKVYLLCSVLLMNIALFSQVDHIVLSAYYSCNGVTLVPFTIWSGTPRPLTVNFERQGAAGTWFNVVSQVYDVQGSYITVGPTDISSATNYRIRAVDMTTLQEYFSNGAVVDPALFVLDRGVPNFTAVANFGTTCSNGYLSVSINATAHGRPPFRVEYKPTSQSNYLLAGEANGFLNIIGVAPNTAYNVRVIDYCGNVAPPQTVVFGMSATAVLLQDATTCTNGKIQVGGSGGTAPLEYGIGKRTADMASILPNFEYRSINVFDSLAPGDYYVRIRDQCGNFATGFIRLAGGFPLLLATSSIPAGDSCSRNITVNPIQGEGPFEYGRRYIQDPQSGWTWQTSSVFTNLTRDGVYFIRIKDKCGQLSDSLGVNIGTIPKPQIDSVRHSSLPGCSQNITVYASGGYKPYEYSSDNFHWKNTDTFNNFSPGSYNFWVRDRCGRVSPYVAHVVPVKDITVYVHGAIDSCNATTGFIAIDSIANGNAPFQYAIRNMDTPGSPWTPFTTDSIFHGLPAGLYSVWVRDGCSAEKIVDSIVVASPFTYDYDLQPGSGCSPFLIINMHGSTNAPYTYFITNGTHNRSGQINDSTLVLTGLPNGTYTITITDACGATASNTAGPVQISLSGTPQITYQIQYLNGCSDANIIVHGAPTGSAYQLWDLQLGSIYERNDSIFTTADYNITSGKYLVVVYNNDYCNFEGFYYQDTVAVALNGVLLTGTVNPNLPDSFCIYNSTGVHLMDYLLDAFPGGNWASTAPQGFDPVTGTFIPSQAGAGDYEFTYSILDSCGSLHETSVFLSVAYEACQIRTIAGDYRASLQPNGCPEVSGGQFSYIDFTDNYGNLLFSINPMGRDLGTVCAGVRIVDGNGSSLRSTIIDGKMTYFLDRNFYIEVGNPYGNSPVTVLLYLTNEEVDDMLNFLHNNGYPQASVSDIRILQKGGDDVDLQVTNEGSLDPQRFVTVTPIMYQNANGWIMQYEVYNFSEFNPHFTGAAVNLPLTLLDFSGANRQGQIRLQWKTTDENNTAYFDVERSSDGNKFNSIARVKASGNSASERFYSHDDLQPLNGNNFYRLKMVDLDGKYTYSKTILVRSVRVAGLKLTPNPAKDHLYISIPDNIMAKAIHIYDAAGRLLYHETVNGSQLLKVQTGHLRNGWYMLELQTTTGSMREAFLKQ